MNQWIEFIAYWSVVIAAILLFFHISKIKKDPFE